MVVVALLVLGCALVAPAGAGAELLTVDSVGEETDAAPGDEFCLTGGGKCTLRAAIEEANALSGEFDEIVFDDEVFDGQPGSTIVLGSSLPPITDRGFINGRECPTAAGVAGPCVGIDGLPGAPALAVENTEEFEIWGLAVTGAQAGVSVDGSTRFKAQASWFGEALDGSVDGNATGISIGPGSDRALIGGEGPERGNVVVGSSGDGIRIHGAAKARVLGNYLGVEKDGVTAAANGKGVEVTSAAGFPASETSIGTKVSFGSSAASPQCDGGCNLISASGASGIDLEGDGGAEEPAVATSIAGNHIGLDADGSGALPNATFGIRVGGATQTVIGGPKAGEANRVNGGTVGIGAGPGAADLVLRGNLVGVDAAGLASQAPPEEGIVVDSGGLSSQAVEARIVDNAVSAAIGAAIGQRGFGATIAGNEVLGAGVGIHTFDPTEEHGNSIERNSIADATGNGILLENNLNEVFANAVIGAGAAGIRILGAPPFGVKENLIGGDLASEENLIFASGGAAIEITNVKKPLNEIARNNGIANGGPFIDLIPAQPETELEGPNGGIEPPQLSAASATEAAGSADPGAHVRVFRKRLGEAGELESLIGEDTADEGGDWEVHYPPLPPGTIVAATQTSEAGGTSELSMTTTTAGESGEADESGGASPGPGPVPPGADTDPPQTRIVAWSPRRKSRRRVARFRFSSDEPGSTFRCRLDRGRFLPCRSPRTYRHLRPGRHVFRVRAIDPAGNPDPTAAKRKFTVLRRR